MIEFKKLSKDFGSFKAVDELSFSVNENCVFGFLGPNGAGKTTTIRMMAGLSKISSGEILIDGEDVKFNDIKTNSMIGYLPEQPSFYTWMTGEEYLSFIGNLFSINDIKNKIEKLLKLVDLSSVKHKKIGTYSNGMKQRLGIAQALINDPKVLIFDEPVSALDPIGRREVLAIIEKLKKDKTIFMSTHILSDVDRICDEVAILNKGKLITRSSLAELKQNYAAPILEIEFNQQPSVAKSRLEKEEWVSKIIENGNKLKVWLKDEKIISDNIPLKILTDCNIGILKYGLVLPEIEDIFVDMVEAKNA